MNTLVFRLKIPVGSDLEKMLSPILEQADQKNHIPGQHHQNQKMRDDINFIFHSGIDTDTKESLAVLLAQAIIETRLKK